MGKISEDALVARCESVIRYYTEQGLSREMAERIARWERHHFECSGKKHFIPVLPTTIADDILADLKKHGNLAN